MGPMRTLATLGGQALTNPMNPFSMTYPARAAAAACEMFVNATQRYGKPEFGIEETEVMGEVVPVTETVVLARPFCRLLHFRRDAAWAEARNDPKVLIVAPMSGHFATLLRGTVESMLPEHEVYVTDWADARDVPVSSGTFDLADYTDYIVEFCEFLAGDGERPAVMAVCQPGVPVLVAGALMSERGNRARPSSITLMGSPIDTRVNQTEVNKLAQRRPISWFEKNVIVMVPWPNSGAMRRVYPGFLQISGFMQMNLDRHVDAHIDHYHHLIEGDGDSAAAHRAFYEEYLAVMDLTAEFFLQTVETVFQKHLIPTGQFRHRGHLIDPAAITDIGLMTVEGEKDDITGRGQTGAAQQLCRNIPDEKKMHYVQPRVGHYGVFNGSRYRNHIQPKIRDFIRARRTMVRR